MQVPAQITFRDLPHSDAVKTHIEEKVEKLQLFCNNMIACHVVVELANKNQQTGNLFNTRINITVPRKELVTTYSEDKDMYISIRNAFEDMTRQLEDYREEKKDHQGRDHQSLCYGKIARLFHTDGFGFIESEDGTEFYFNANHVSHPAFHNLTVGMSVHFVEEHSNNGDGPQAHHVRASE